MTDFGRKVALRRVHTGDHVLDAAQREAQEAGRTLNKLHTAVTSHDIAVAALLRTYGVGITRLALPDAAYTVHDTDMACGQIVFTGTLSAARAITLWDATDATAYRRWFVNLTTGGFALTLTTTQGTLSLPNGAHYAVWTSATGPSAESTG